MKGLQRLAALFFDEQILHAVTAVPELDADRVHVAGVAGDIRQPGVDLLFEETGQREADRDQGARRSPQR